MSIVIEKDESGNDIYRYKRPKWKILYNQINELCELLKKYVDKQNGLSLEDLSVNMILMSELFIRIDKRKDYFTIYHKGTNINEIKKAALLAYWLIKFKPIIIKYSDKEDFDKFNKFRYINESFAVFIVYGAVKAYSDSISKTKFCVSKDYHDLLNYAFKFWDLSKEAVILIAETLCESARHQNRRLGILKRGKKFNERTMAIS